MPQIKVQSLRRSFNVSLRAVTVRGRKSFLYEHGTETAALVGRGDDEDVENCGKLLDNPAGLLEEVYAAIDCQKRERGLQ